MEHYYCNLWGEMCKFFFFFDMKAHLKLYRKWSLEFPLNVIRFYIRSHIGEYTNDKVHT